MPTSGADEAVRLVLDTSAYSHFRRGDERVIARMAAAPTVVLPVTVLGELEAAFELGRRGRENRRMLAELLDEEFVGVWPATVSVARHYGQLFAQLKRAGTPVPVNDIWIAAITIDCSGELLTFDTDYGRIPDLNVVILDVRA